jgi:hypothetical protein
LSALQSVLVRGLAATEVSNFEEECMNYRSLVLLAAAVIGLGFVSVAGAQMSMSESAPGMNYSGKAASTSGPAALLTDMGMNYAGEIANTPPALAVVPLDAAVRAAENQVAGKAFSAELERT